MSRQAVNAALQVAANVLHENLQAGSGLVLQLFTQLACEVVAFRSHDTFLLLQLLTAVAPFGAKHAGS